MNVGSLFSGIGGLDLGLERAGMNVIWQSEIDPYASRVLAKHWPTVPNLGDITRIDWSTVARPDLICGGYPCQPFSLAGVRRGDADPRHLWPHFADAIRHLRPRWALLENVPGHLSLGFGRVLGDLAELGYDTDWDCIPAAAVGAPHLRYRVLVVAHAQRDGLRQQPVSVIGGRGPAVALADGAARAVADPDRGRLEVSAQLDGEPVQNPANGDSRGGHPDGLRDEMADADGPGPSGRPGEASRRPGPSRRVEPQRLGSSLTGFRRTAGRHWAVEPDVGRVAHGVPARVDRLRTLGNAVVPQVAEWIGHRIMEAAA